MDFNHPLTESVVVPLATALLLTGVLRWGLGSRFGVRLAGSAVAVALLVALVLIIGYPVWLPSSGPQKLPMIAALMLFSGGLIDLFGLRRRFDYVVGILGVGVSGLWLSWPLLWRGETDVLLKAFGASLIAMAVLPGLLGAREQGVNRPGMLVAVAVGLAAAAFNAGSLLLLQVALAMASAVGGFALWSWPKPRLQFTAAASLPAFVSAFAVALLILLLTAVRPWALLPLAFVFLADPIARRLPVPGRLQRTTMEPLYILAFGLLMAVAATLLSQAPATGEDLYYR